ncbi:ABC transporter ATP-binding protein [Clostridium sp. AN503]|uniref:ABC transporter ATP-binding protein n=1 Tax=Clostridium sp. AN503 TaxID=3160598 RepID=UPI00345854B8
MIKKEVNKDVFLSIRDLVVEYQSEGKTVHAVNGVSFDLEKGKTIGLVGETGAGKTSIAKAILRILPDHATKRADGVVWLDGRDIMEIPETEMQKLRGHTLSMIFQDPMTALNPVKTVADQIAEVVKLHTSLGKAESLEKAKEMLGMVGISPDRAGEYPHQFSGGMKQRVVIAMALACSPQVLIADEPTTALDVTIQAQVLEMINELKEELQTSMIMITHDLGVVAETCDTVAVTYAGQIIEYGTLEDIFDHPAHPYTIGLFRALPNMNKGVERLSPIEGLPPDPTDLPAGCSFSPRCPYASEACRSGEIKNIQITDTHECRCIRVKKEEV